MSRTRAGLLAGAARAFAEHGLRRSTMQSVATAAGVAKATLYNHFRTKGDVVRALLAAELDRLADVAAALPVEQALAALADECGTHPVLRRLAADEPDRLAALLAAAEAPWVAGTARLAGALAVDQDAAELVARWLIGVVAQPGTASARQRQAALLAAVVSSPTVSPAAAPG